MAEPVSGGSGSQPPKEMSMELRLLLAFILMGVVMFVSQYYFKSTTPPPKAQQTASKSAAPAESKPAETPAAPAAPAEAPPAEAKADEAAPAPNATPQQAQSPVVIDTDLYRVTFSNQGANVRSWVLKKFKETNGGDTLELVNSASGLPYPFSLSFPDRKPAKDPNWAYFVQTPDADGLGVAFDYSDGHTTIHKQFRFEKNNYISKVSTTATIDGAPLANQIVWRGGFGDLTVNNPAADQRTLHFDAANNKLVEQTVRDAKNGPASASGNFTFAGVADKYFAAIFLPQLSNNTQVTTLKDNVKIPPVKGDDGKPVEQKPADFTGLLLSNGTENRFELFVGPKDLDLLNKINPKLAQVVDFGWFSILAKPLFYIVNWFNDSFVHNYGWSIVLVTIAINFAMFPLKLSNMKSMRKMQALKPQIDAINAKYKNLKMTDPKKQEGQQEVMALYKKNGVNPMGGCVPMLLQLPFFFAFWQVFTKSVEMRGASWLWVSDLSQPEHLAIKILPILMIASQFLMQKMTPQPNQDPAQQKMMMFMPLIFGYMFYWFASGLVLYYLTSNLVSMGQQWFFNHTEAAQEAARSVEPPKKQKNGRK